MVPNMVGLYRTNPSNKHTNWYGDQIQTQLYGSIDEATRAFNQSQSKQMRGDHTQGSSRRDITPKPQHMLLSNCSMKPLPPVQGPKWAPIQGPFLVDGNFQPPYVWSGDNLRWCFDTLGALTCTLIVYVLYLIYHDLHCSL